MIRDLIKILEQDSWNRSKVSECSLVKERNSFDVFEQVYSFYYKGKKLEIGYIVYYDENVEEKKHYFKLIIKGSIYRSDEPVLEDMEKRMFTIFRNIQSHCDGALKDIMELIEH